MPKMHARSMRQVASKYRGAPGKAVQKREEAPLRPGQARCPGCKRPVRYRATGKLANTLYSHSHCPMGTSSNIGGFGKVELNLDELERA